MDLGTQMAIPHYQVIVNRDVRLQMKLAMISLAFAHKNVKLMVKDVRNVHLDI